MSSIVLNQPYTSARGVKHANGDTISVPFAEGVDIKAKNIGRYLTDGRVDPRLMETEAQKEAAALKLEAEKLLQAQRQLETEADKVDDERTKLLKEREQFEADKRAFEEAKKKADSKLAEPKK